MLVTELAYRDMEACTDGLAARLRHLMRRLCGRFRASHEAHAPDRPAPDPISHLRLVPAVADCHAPNRPAATPSIDAFRWRRHPQLLRQPMSTLKHDSEDLERGARSASVRGLFLARSGRFDEARVAFALAAVEPSVDLTAIPGFWDLSRAGMTAAVGAYEDVERIREAAALGARIRLHYRPRTVSAIPVAPRQRTSASGG